MDTEELGVVNGVGFGMRDCAMPVLWFAVKCLSGEALQVFGIERATRLIEEAECYDVRDLEGKPCVVSTDGNIMTFVRWHK